MENLETCFRLILFADILPHFQNPDSTAAPHTKRLGRKTTLLDFFDMPLRFVQSDTSYNIKHEHKITAIYKVNKKSEHLRVVVFGKLLCKDIINPPRNKQNTSRAPWCHPTEAAVPAVVPSSRSKTNYLSTGASRPPTRELTATPIAAHRVEHILQAACTPSSNTVITSSTIP